MARYYSWCYCFITYVLLILSSNVNATQYWRTTITHDVQKVTALGKKTNFENQQQLEDKTLKANLLFTDSVREKLGATVKDRLFRNTEKGGAYSTLASSQLKSLFEAKEYIVDFDSKTIYTLDQGTGFGCKNFGYKWKAGDIEYDCPADAANRIMLNRCTGNITNCSLDTLYSDQYFQNPISLLPNKKSSAPAKIYFKIKYTYKPTATQDYLTDSITKGSEIPISDADKHILTNIEIANIIIASQSYIKELFTADNVFEITNNKAYLELAFALNNSTNEESPDTGIKPTPPDPVIGGQGFNLPSFCDWAKPVCDFFSWMKEEMSDPGDSQVEITKTALDTQGSPKQDKKYLDYQYQCPSAYEKTVKIFDQDWTMRFDYDFLCLFLSKMSTFFVAFSYLISAIIISGVRH